MLRVCKEIDWSKHLTEADLAFLTQRIEPMGWYPMETFERMGIGILAEITLGELMPVRAWGRASIDSLCVSHPALLAAGKPRESLTRFHAMRRSFFDYGAIELTDIGDTQASAQVAYGMSAKAEEAATWQTLGFFDRLLELSGGRDVEVECTAKSWEGAPVTLVSLRWK
jgi:hypothetical protein